MSVQILCLHGMGVNSEVFCMQTGQAFPSPENPPNNLFHSVLSRLLALFLYLYIH